MKARRGVRIRKSDQSMKKCIWGKGLLWKIEEDKLN